MKSFSMSALFAAAPEQIYCAWLDPDGHTAMTGAEAAGSGAVGGEFTAWDGYISAKTLELVPNRRIVQAWRTSEFSAEDPDSRLTVEFDPVEGGTRVTLHHSEIASGAENYQQGWEDYYFAPMRAHFGPTP